MGLNGGGKGISQHIAYTVFRPQRYKRTHMIWYQEYNIKMLISDSNVGKKNAVRKNIHYSFKFYIHNMILYIWKKSD